MGGKGRKLLGSISRFGIHRTRDVSPALRTVLQGHRVGVATVAAGGCVIVDHILSRNERAVLK